MPLVSYLKGRSVRENMEMYSGFALLYDAFMEEVPYGFWADNILRLFREHGITEGIVADLGCGTGALTLRLAEAGYDMIGIDSSWEMLDAAREKSSQKGRDIIYLCQDMRSFELYGTCAAIISTCDSINYILNPADLVEVFRLVNNYLDPGGLFVFDCNSPYKYEKLLGDRVFAENSERGSFIWENEYSPVSKENVYYLSLYVKEEDSDLYARFEEKHVQRAYDLEEIKAAAEQAGLVFGQVYDADDFGEIKEDTQRYLITMYENGKQGGR